MTDSVESVLQKLAEELSSTRSVAFQYDDIVSLLRSALGPMLAELEQGNAGLRKHIHHLEGHNQFFFRCESGWCNPSERFGANPAMETLKQVEQRAEAAEQALREAQAELVELKEHCESEHDCQFCALSPSPTPAQEEKAMLTCICGVSFSADNQEMLDFHNDCPKARFINKSCPHCGNSSHFHVCPRTLNRAATTGKGEQG